jgi:hypothetical protein
MSGVCTIGLEFSGEVSNKSSAALRRLMTRSVPSAGDLSGRDCRFYAVVPPDSTNIEPLSVRARGHVHGRAQLFLAACLWLVVAITNYERGYDPGSTITTL